MPLLLSSKCFILTVLNIASCHFYTIFYGSSIQVDFILLHVHEFIEHRVILWMNSFVCVFIKNMLHVFCFHLWNCNFAITVCVVWLVNMLLLILVYNYVFKHVYIILQSNDTVNLSFRKRISGIFTRDSIYAIARICYGNSVCLSVRPSVCPSVCHTGGSVKNSWS